MKAVIETGLSLSVIFCSNAVEFAPSQEADIYYGCSDRNLQMQLTVAMKYDGWERIRKFIEKEGLNLIPTIDEYRGSVAIGWDKGNF